MIPHTERMPAVPTVVTDAVLEHRRRLGIDKRDERWEGEWHLVNPPKVWHVSLGLDLVFALRPLAEARGLRAYAEGGIFGADNDWRIPDQMYARPDSLYGDAGWTTAELVVEIRSPGDDSYKKLPFYASRGVREVLILHENRRVELYRPDRHGDMALVQPDEDGRVRCETLGTTLATVPGPLLRITWDGGSVQV